ncbi:MAG: hydrogenase 4 subunit F, partial [Lysobacterales bacterium]
MIELALLLSIPLAGAAVLAVVGARRSAPEVNVGFSAATFLAACALTTRVIGDGSFTALGEQFFIDAFNVFLVTLTAFVSFTTSLFSRPYMRIESEHGRVKPQHLRLYHSM